MFYSLVPYLLDIHINVSLLQINDILQPVFIVRTAAPSASSRMIPDDTGDI